MNQELVMPCRKDGTLILGPICDISGEYTVVNGINFYNNENDKIFPFLWFLSNIIDNISKHAQNKKPMDSFSYFFQPALFQHQMRERVFRKKESTQEKDYWLRIFWLCIPSPGKNALSPSWKNCCRCAIGWNEVIFIDGYDEAFITVFYFNDIPFLLSIMNY